MPFLSELVLQETGQHTWRLIADLVYEGRPDMRPNRFIVPDGFETDLASVPQVFLWLVPRSGRYTKAAVLHDWLCKEAERGAMRRFDADGIFRRVMRELGVSKVRRSLMWAAVRWGKPSTLFQGGIGWGLRAFAIPLLALPALPVGMLAVLVLALMYLEEWAVYVFERLRGVPAQRPAFNWWS